MANNQRREGGHGLTNISRDSSKDDLALILCAHRRSKVGVVPCVDFAVPADERSVGIHGGDFLGYQPVRACFGAGGEDDGDVEELGHC